MVSAFDDDLRERLARLELVWISKGRPHMELERCLAGELATSSYARGQPFERFNERPASEPVMAGKWERLARGPMTEALADNLVSSLLGHPARIREGGGCSAGNAQGVRSHYPDPWIAKGWIERLAEWDNRSASPFVSACLAYAEIAISHPYTDGNGRLARVGFQRALARRSQLSAPLLPLGPLIYANHKAVIAALVHVGTTGRWEPMLTTMAQLVRKSSAFTRTQLEVFAF